MGEKKTTDILDQLAGTYLAIEELNEAIPAIRKEFEKGQETYESIKNFDKEIEKKVKEFNSLTKSTMKKMDEAETRISELLAQIEERINELGSVETILARVKELEEKISDIGSLNSEVTPDIVERLDSIEERLDEHDDNITELFDSMYVDDEEDSEDDDDDDDDETTVSSGFSSIEYLWEHNRKKLLLVVRKKWSNDYCFCVHKISRGYAEGAIFVNGVMTKERTSYPATTEEFKEYTGPSRRTINAQYD